MKTTITLCVAISVLSLCGPELKAQPPSVGMAVPDIYAPDANGQIRQLSQLYSNHYVLLHYWASWDASSGTRLPEFAELNTEMLSQNPLLGQGGGLLEVFSVSLDTDLWQWQDASRYYEVNWQNNVCDGLGPNSPTAWQMGLNANLPFTTLLIAPGGKVEAVNPSTEYLRQRFLTPVARYQQPSQNQYRIYVGRFHNTVLSVSDFSALGNVQFTPSGPNHNFVEAYTFTSLEQVVDALQTLHQTGYKEAFIVVRFPDDNNGSTNPVAQLGNTGYDGLESVTATTSGQTGFELPSSTVARYNEMTATASATITTLPQQSAVSDAFPVYQKTGMPAPANSGYIYNGGSTQNSRTISTGTQLPNPPVSGGNSPYRPVQDIHKPANLKKPNSAAIKQFKNYYRSGTTSSPAGNTGTLPGNEPPTPHTSGGFVVPKPDDGYQDNSAPASPARTSPSNSRGKAREWDIFD